MGRRLLQRVIFFGLEKNIFSAINDYYLLSILIFSLLILPGGFLIGETITERFPAPEGFQKHQIGQNSFAEFLRNYPLKPQGSPVYHFDGSEKNKEVHVAVLDFPLLKKDLIQCADAIIKLRAEYLFSRGFYNKIKFKITNGMDVPFSEFAKGKRVRVRGNNTTWIEDKFKKGNNREVFDEYLFFIYSYAGTASLGKELVTVQPKDIKIGDLFLEAGSPGHAVLVVDLAKNPSTNEKIFLLAQSYMPSQDMHILKSFENISPWYRIPKGNLETPEWTFSKNSLVRIKD